MRVSRRAFVGAGLTASLWTTPQRAMAAPQALEAGPIELALAAAPTPPRRRSATAAKARDRCCGQGRRKARARLPQRAERADLARLSGPARTARPTCVRRARRCADRARRQPRNISIAASEPGFQIYGALARRRPRAADGARTVRAADRRRAAAARSRSRRGRACSRLAARRAGPDRRSLRSRPRPRRGSAGRARRAPTASRRRCRSPAPPADAFGCGSAIARPPRACIWRSTA